MDMEGYHFRNLIVNMSWIWKRVDIFDADCRFTCLDFYSFWHSLRLLSKYMLSAQMGKA